MTSDDHAPNPGAPLPVGAPLPDPGKPRPTALREAAPAGRQAVPGVSASVEYWYFCDDGSAMRRD